MIRSLLAALLLIAGAPALAWTPPDNSDAAAVIVGNRSYEAAGHGVPDVEFAHNDAAAFARYAREVLGIREKKIFVYKDVGTGGMLRLFGSERNPRGLVRQLAELGNEEIFVFYSGHGVPAVQAEGPPEGYLLPVDIPAGEPEFGGYPLSLLLENLSTLPADRVTVFLDACFSGQSEAGTLNPNVSGAFGVAVAAPEQTASVSVLSATAFDRPQVAHWLPEKEMGAFTYFLVRGLYGGADGYGKTDGRVCLDEVEAYLKDTLSLEMLSRRSEQVASLRGPGDVALTVFDGDKRPSFPFERVLGTFEEPWSAPTEPGARFREPLEGGGEAPEMVVIPDGLFWMGSPDGEAGRYSNEGPQHRRTIAPFALGRTEVTVGEFRLFVEETGRDMSGCYVFDGKWKNDPARSWRAPGFSQVDDHPVACVSWDDAVAFVDWLNGKVDGDPYRLPTEAEWEYAARAERKGGRREPAYSWGASSDGACEWANSGDLTVKQTYTDWSMVDCRDGHVYTAPAGSYRPNGFGLFDMTGNLWECTQDCWHESYRNAPGDQRAWLEENGGNCTRRVVRGGSWGGAPRQLRAANRMWLISGGRFSLRGFRVARTLKP